jgi:hypothetical protein
MIGDWKLEIGNWKLEIGNWKLEIGDSLPLPLLDDIRHPRILPPMKPTPSKPRHHAVTILIIALAIPLLAGCGPKTTVSDNNGNKVTYDKDKKTADYQFTTPDGTKTHATVGENVTIPADFPSDAAAYPKASIIAASSSSELVQLIFKTPDSANDVLAFYQKQLKDNGWEIDNTMNMGTGTLLQTKKANRRQTLMINQDGQGASVNLQILTQKNP